MGRTSEWKTWEEEAGLRKFGNRPVLSRETYPKIKFVFYAGQICRVLSYDATDGRLHVEVSRTDEYPCNHVSIDRGEYTIAGYHFTNQEATDLAKQMSKNNIKRKRHIQ